MRCRTLDAEYVADLSPTDAGIVRGQRRLLHGVGSRLEVLALAPPLGVPPGFLQRCLRFGETLQVRAVRQFARSCHVRERATTPP